MKKSAQARSLKYKAALPNLDIVLRVSEVVCDPCVMTARVSCVRCSDVFRTEVKISRMVTGHRRLNLIIQLRHCAVGDCR